MCTYSQLSKKELNEFNLLYKTYYKKLCYLAFHLLQSQEMAEEVVDDAMFYIWEHRRDLEFNKIEGYLIKVVKHLSINELNSASLKYHRRTSTIDLAEGSSFFLSMFDDEHPLEELLRKELDSQIKTAIGNLPSLTRDIYMLNKVEGLRYKDIAKRKAMSEQNVKYHMAKANQYILECLAKYFAVIVVVHFF